MTIIQAIQIWSMEQPSWQQDAVARLYFEKDLSDEDFEDLYALLKAEHGIPDLKVRQARGLNADAVAVPVTDGREVLLTAIKDLRGVNAIAEGQRLGVGPTGLSVIYGGNGTGKSGYSRVLKKACRARDQNEPILPNAKLQPGTAPVANATFELTIDGNLIEQNWTDGQPAPEVLSAIAIFDSHCARAYVDNQGDFAYSPYGLDILEGLVKACSRLKRMAEREVIANKPNLEPLAELRRTATRVGEMLTGLTGETDTKTVESLATMSGDESSRLEALNSALAEADPKQKAQALKLQAARFESLACRIDSALALLADDKVAKLRKLIGVSRAAKDAAAIAANHFAERGDLLAGTGSDSWRALFEAARAFVVESNPDAEFPQSDPTALCPLCQNSLGDAGVTRLESFDGFIRQEAEKVAKSAREAAASAYSKIAQGDFDLRVDEALRAELDSWNPEVGKACDKTQEELVSMQKAICDAAGGEIEWEEVPTMRSDSSERLREGIAAMLESAKTLEESLDEKTRAALTAEHAELSARRQLGALKSVVLEAISKLDLTAKLKACIGVTGTTGISRKSTALAKSMATPEVAAALNKELKALLVDDLQVVMKNVSPGGRTQFKLALELPGGVKPAEILSEGEQRAIAIASFLAEIDLDVSSAGVVFDDPVCSLDHRRRSAVASRLAFEATKRQVIIFTHDIFFLRILQTEAEKLKVDIAAQSVCRSPAGFGTQVDRLPFEAMPTKKRIGALREMQVSVDKAYREGDEGLAKRRTYATYRNLRMAWERAVEEVLLQGVVNRFQLGVSTQMLAGVVVEDDDYRVVEAGMAKCSTFEHEPGADAELATPTPAELGDDIEALESFRVGIAKRVEAVRRARK